jgi:hypothetical protein
VAEARHGLAVSRELPVRQVSNVEIDDVSKRGSGELGADLRFAVIGRN